MTAVVTRGQSVRFIIVGIWNTFFGYAAFVLLETLFSHILDPPYVAYMSAMVLGQIIAILNAYVFHKFVTFRSKVRGWAMASELLRFSMTYAATFFLSLALLPFLVEIVHIAPKISGLIITLLCTGISYIGHSTFSFRSKATD